MTQKVTDAQVEAALIAAKGLLSDAAEQLGITRQSLHDRCTGAHRERWDKVREAIRQSLLDRAEKTVFKEIEKDAKLALRYLHSQGKDRGYVTRTQVTGKDGAPLFDIEGMLGGLDDDTFAKIDALRRNAREGAGTDT